MANPTVQTQTILDRLVAGKREELNLRLVTVPLRAIEAQARLRPAPLPLGPALRGDRVRLIAELKKASPAAGLLEAEFNPIDRAVAYVRAGASAISILTEEQRFMGSLEHLTAVRDALDASSAHPEPVEGRAKLDEQPAGSLRRPPLLRKDFL